MAESREVREEFEKLAARNDFSMATIVDTHMTIRTIGGGDHVGDIESRSSSEQFVWTRDKAALGWCLGGRAFEMAQQLLLDPQELADFKNAVEDAFNCHLQFLRDQLETLDSGEDKE
jgi:hypothetical protein